MSDLSSFPINVSSDEIEKFLNIWAKKQVIYEKLRKYFTDKFAEKEVNNANVIQVNIPLDDFKILHEYWDCNDLIVTSDRANLELGLYGQLWGANLYVKSQFNHIEFLTDSD
jgi:ribosome-associated toxin RatA of RatAB toxin-antitoxin module